MAVKRKPLVGADCTLCIRVK